VFSRRCPLGTRQGLDPRVAPVFETGDPRYSWINEVQAVGKGVLSADKTRLDYELCEVRQAQGLRDRSEPLRESCDRRAIKEQSVLPKPRSRSSPLLIQNGGSGG
jgi:hypothetical protein